MSHPVCGGWVGQIHTLWWKLTSYCLWDYSITLQQGLSYVYMSGYWKVLSQTTNDNNKHLLECSPIVWGTRVQIQVESYQRLKKWYLMLPCLTLSLIKYGSRVKWSNPGNGVAPSPIPHCSSHWKRSLWVAKFTLFKWIHNKM